MAIFVRFVATDKGKIKQTSLSREVLDAIRHVTPLPVTPEAVEVLLDHLIQHDDLWYDDALSMNVAAGGAFFAIKHAFHALQLVTYAIPETSLEEEHIINMLKKHGYWPWY